MVRFATLVLTLATLSSGGLAVGAQTVPVPTPRPFPGSGGASSTPTATPKPADPAPQVQPAVAAPPSAPAPAAAAGVPVYPTAEYLDTFDAGSGQQYVLYGTNVGFAEIVSYYRTVLKTGGRELFKTPATHQFDLGRFQEDRMAYPPSVVVKDYTWNNSPGYPVVSGATEKRFKTIIQIVAPGPGQ